jgi:hypothetical protein
MPETVEHSLARWRSMQTERSGTMRIGGTRPDPLPRSMNPTSEHAHLTTNSTNPTLSSPTQQLKSEMGARSQGLGNQAWAVSGDPKSPNPRLSQYHDLPRGSLDSWHALGRTVADVLSRAAAEEGEDYLDFGGAGADLYYANTVPVSNPRDHSVLETAYKELHAARFINLAPLAILNSVLVLHFKGLFCFLDCAWN